MNEPQLSFDNARLKVKWANDHIDHLEAICNTYIERNANLPLTEFKTEHGVTYGYAAEPLTLAVTLLAGDIVRNLRGALDYCWTGLYRSTPNASEKTKLTLPIATNRKGVGSLVDQTDVGKAFPAAKVLLADNIGTHADFADNGNKPIVVLNRLANWEKHNLLIFATRVVQNINFTFGEGNRVSIGNFIGPSHMIMGTGPNGDPSVQSQGDASAQIIFGQHDFIEHEPIFPLMRQLSQATAEAVQLFAETFT